MEFLKNLFNGGALTFEQLEEAVKNAKLKVVDISGGAYVSKNKYEDDIKAKDTQIQTLNDTIKSRDTDLANIKTQLEAAGADSAKLTTLTNDLASLQTKYDADTKTYQEQLKKQAYEFAVKEFANTKNFTSQAAKRDFTNSMIAKNLTYENDKIIGADDFVEMYSKDNADAFVVEKQDPVPPEPPKPTFVNPTPGGAPAPTEVNPFNFNFTGVRPKPQN